MTVTGGNKAGRQTEDNPESETLHAGSPLEGGRVSGHRFRCPRHGYIFDLETGVSSRGPKEGFGPLRFFELEEEDGYYVTILEPKSDNCALSG